jgi:hypothetical protein
VRAAPQRATPARRQASQTVKALIIGLLIGSAVAAALLALWTHDQDHGPRADAAETLGPW